MPSDRDMAVALWVLIAVIAALAYPKTRDSALGVVRAAITPKIAIPVLVFAAYLAAVAFQVSKIGLWNPDLATDTVAWFVGPGFGLVYGVGQVSAGKLAFRRLALSAFGLTALVEVYINLYDFGFFVEFFLAIPIVTILVITRVVAEADPETRSVGRILDGALAVVGLVFLVVVLAHLIADRASIDTSGLLRSFLLPLWLIVAALPALGLMSLLFGYSDAMTMAGMTEATRADRLRLLIAFVSVFKFNLHDLHGCRVFWTERALESSRMSETRGVLREYLKGRQADRAATVAAERRLEQFAGAEGTDEQGRQLDQREFKETKVALQTLWSSQIGWYRKNARFREDLVALFESNFVRRGLLEPTSITMEVSADGQAWFAWRSTITGFCLAIGMASGPTEGKPPIEWLYAGPDPPTGYPEEDPAWGEPWGIDFPDW